jgi:hypothetical protein
MADTVVLELLRGRTLLVDVVAVTCPEGLVHLSAWNVDGLDRAVVQAPPVAGVLEHRERLAAVVDEHPFAPELVPGEREIGGAGREEEAVLLVDLGEVDRGRPRALFQRAEGLRRRRLADLHCSVHDPLDRGRAGRGDGMFRLQSFVLQEAAGDGGDQRRVEGGEARELDADFVAHDRSTHTGFTSV